MPTPREWAEQGKVLRITRWNEPVMHRPTEPITDFGPDLHQLIADMFATMEVAEGVGLAATQVGVGKSVFIYHCPDDDDRLRYGVVCNPQVTLPEGGDRRLDATEEGCLSWPGAYQPLARPNQAVCEGVDENGQPVRIEATGLLARCVQHETDHLNGTVFGDRLSSRSRRLLDEQHDQLTELYPDDWPITAKRRRTDILAD